MCIRDRNEVPNADQTYRFRVRVRPNLRLTGTGNYNLLEGISLGDIEENRVFLSTTDLNESSLIDTDGDVIVSIDSERSYGGRILVSPGGNTAQRDSDGTRLVAIGTDNVLAGNSVRVGGINNNVQGSTAQAADTSKHTQHLSLIHISEPTRPY